MHSNCSIDWLSVTTPHSRSAKTPKHLINSYVEKPGRLGFKVCYQFDNGIQHLWSDDRPHVHIIYTGKTLKKISEVRSIDSLVQWHIDLGHRVSRIDVAVDIFDSKTEVSDYVECWKTGKIKTRSKKGLYISDPKNIDGDTFYIGSLKKRRKLMRIYDKAKEQRVDKDWIRFEMQFGQGAARSAAKQIADTKDLSTTIKAQMRGFATIDHETYINVFGDVIPMKVSHDMPEGETDRMRWIMRCVLPALTEEEKQQPGFMGILARLVQSNIDEENKFDRHYVK